MFPVGYGRIGYKKGFVESSVCPPIKINRKLGSAKAPNNLVDCMYKYIIYN